MDPLENHLFDLTRRQFLGRGAAGLCGTAALTSLNASGMNLLPQVAPKAKRVIYLFQEGGPSHVDTYDYKPALQELEGRDLRSMPEVYQGQRLTGMTANRNTLPLRPSPFKFDHYPNNQDGIRLSEMLPHTGRIAKELCFVHSMCTEAINHGPGVTLMQTGNQLAGRPAIGAWTSYGLGSVNDNLPSFVVLVSKGRGQMQALLSRYWGSAFLPSQHQGVRLRADRDAVLFLTDPDGMTRSDRRHMLDVVSRINQRDHAANGDSEVLARVAQYELAYRMQMAVPELTDVSGEDEKTLEMYGPAVREPGSFAANCLLARRMAERGVRFIQLYHRGWDAHVNIPGDIPQQCGDTDQAQAALIRDLKRRGLLDDTLVVCGGEFGRTPYAQVQKNNKWGRDHHPRCFTVWLAGGGVQPGITFGRTDEVGYNIVDKDGKTITGSAATFHPAAVHVHDLHATMLHQLGIDHTRLTYRYQGRDFRLTDVHGHIRRELLL